MQKFCLIKQSYGLGDIIYCQKIIKIVQRNTPFKKIVWPVSIHQYCLDLNKHLDGNGIEFCDEKSNFAEKELYLNESHRIVQKENCLFLPLGKADEVVGRCKRHKCCHSLHEKYDFCNIDYSDWYNYFNFKRDFEKECQLVGLMEVDLSQPYNVINQHVRYRGALIRTDLIPNNNYRNVYMYTYEGYSMFDWIKILENAAEIHTVNTSLVFLLEKLNLQNVFVYSRYVGSENKPTYEDFVSEVSSVRTKNWKFFL